MNASWKGAAQFLDEERLVTSIAKDLMHSRCGVSRSNHQKSRFG